MLRALAISTSIFAPALLPGLLGAVQETAPKTATLSYGLLILAVGLCIAAFTAVLKHVSNGGIHISKGGAPLVTEKTCEATREGVSTRIDDTKESIHQRIDDSNANINTRISAVAENLTAQLGGVQTQISSVLRLVKDMHKNGNS